MPFWLKVTIGVPRLSLTVTVVSSLPTGWVLLSVGLLVVVFDEVLLLPDAIVVLALITGPKLYDLTYCLAGPPTLK